jgi:hypothetical protein
MAQGPAGKNKQDLRALRHELTGADDVKFRRIIAMLDQIGDPAVNRDILDPVRTRLAALKPARPLGFSRLLFFPLDPAIVQTRNWKPGEPTVPRSALAPISALVRAEIGGRASEIERIAAHHKTDVTQAITIAGEALWPLAAAILAVAPAPADWGESGLRLSAYQPLAHTIAAVLRRATRLRRLVRDEKIGVLAPDSEVLEDLLTGIASEPAEGRAMISQLILVQCPHSVPTFRLIVSSNKHRPERGLLQRAAETGLEEALHHLESESGLREKIGRAGLADVGYDVRQAVAFLSNLEIDAAAVTHRHRAKAIRENLDRACRSKFASGLKEGLVVPLAMASGPMDPAGQTRLETCARNLRALETVARKLGGPSAYDQMLMQATQAVRAASGSGALSGVRTIRLTEILAGPDVAMAMYVRHAAV